MVDTVAINNKFALDMKMGPVFQTTVIPLMGGYEDRNQDWQVALWRYDVSLNNRPLSEIRSFMAHVLGRRGSANAFPLRDPLDNTLTDENIGTGDGVTTEFRITKTYADDNRPYRRPLAIVSNLVVKVAGVTQDEETDYEQQDGWLSFTDAPTAGQAITVTCDFLIPVRYQADLNPITLPIGPGASNAFASAGPITLMEAHVPKPDFGASPPPPPFWYDRAFASLTADSSGWSGYTMRQVIDASAILSPGGTQTRVTLDASIGSGGVVIGDAFIGTKDPGGDHAYDFGSTPTRLTFSGNVGATIAQGARLVSDPAAFAPQTGDGVVIAIYFSGSSSTRSAISVPGWGSFYKLGNDVSTGNASGYNLWSQALCVSKIEGQ
ncbi:MAG: hypothetical protein E5Y88_22330 [Mesorhizobium sp.]|uniref:DUF2460 domain-containing protein n=1 Tax=Mesorhizobium sp. TaxID=1871066 RepID=UPI0011F91BC7|nr:DUF2460 domain-containing protein [Mesorhizobium sp.]TIL23666.1 MAG: hypothetical protein E5Y88_22330 [Mesorhizobium sp.]